jgi:membrane-bound serine protease (ClpP class)
MSRHISRPRAGEDYHQGSEMVEIGVILAVVGVALLVAEAHVPGGVLGATGGVALAGGAALALAGAGGGVAVILGVVLGTLAATTLWLALVARKALDTRRLRSPTGREALAGRCGVVRSWQNGDGQVFVDGALWRARPSWPDSDEQITAGDSVVVERVSGLTLAVRRAEEWEED